MPALVGKREKSLLRNLTPRICKAGTRRPRDIEEQHDEDGERDEERQ